MQGRNPPGDVANNAALFANCNSIPIMWIFHPLDFGKTKLLQLRDPRCFGSNDIP